MKVTAVTVLLWIGVSIGVSVGASWSMLNNHATNPHKDAIHKEWFRHHIEQEKEFRDIHTEAIQALHKDMKSLLERLIDK